MGSELSFRLFLALKSALSIGAGWEARSDSMRARSGKLIVYAKGLCETMLHPASNGSVRSGNIWPPKHPRVPVSVPRPDQGEHHDPEYVAQLLT